MRKINLRLTGIRETSEDSMLRIKMSIEVVAENFPTVGNELNIQVSKA